MNQNIKNGIKTAGRVFGLLVVLFAVVWVGMRGFENRATVTEALANAIAGIQSFFTPSERIVISVVDSQIVVDEPFTLVWEHRGKDTDGSYMFSYDCKEGVYLSQKNNMNVDNTLFCNTEIPLLDSETELSLTAHGSVLGVIELPVHIAYTENGSPRVNLTGDAVLGVQDERFDDATSTDETDDVLTPTVPAQTTTVPQTITVPVVSTPNLFGKADLIVRVIGYGLVDNSSGAFEELDEIPRNLPSGKRGAIRFEVVNVGTNVSGEWRFEAELPTSPNYTYKSDDQQTLFPGDKIVYTLGFNKVRRGDEDDYRIEVDTRDDVDESNENNNVVNGTVQID